MDNKKRYRFQDIPLFSKILISIFICILVFITYMLLFQNHIIRQGFTVLEENYGLHDLTQTENLLDRELESLDYLLKDWAFWDDTYFFSDNANKDYVYRNLIPNTFFNTSLNMLYIFNKNQELIWGKLYDLDEEKDITTDRFTREILIKENILFNMSDLKGKSFTDAVTKGFILTDFGILLLTSRPILKSDLTGPPSGTMIMGKLLTPEYHKHLNKLLQNKINIYSKRDLKSNQDLKTIHDNLIKLNTPYSIRKEKTHINIYKNIYDISGEPIILLETYTTRSITEQGAKTLRQYSIWFFIILFSVSGILILFLNFTIIHPIKKITLFLKTTKKDGSESQFLNVNRKDEIGFLADTINNCMYKMNCQTLELKQLNTELHEKATTDALTGLLNRHGLDENMKLLWQTIRRDKSTISAILLDIDFFKKYNDTYGHQRGDNCIQIIADVILSSLQRSTDLAVRYGGEEFLIILPSTNIVGTREVAERMIETIRNKKIEHKTSEIGKYLSISIGIAEETPSKTNNPKDLIEHADIALYQSKDQGRNRLTVYSKGD